MQPSYIMTENAITVFYTTPDGSHVHTLDSSDPDFINATKAIHASDYDALIEAVKPKAAALQEYFSKSDASAALVIKGSTIYYNGEPLPQNYTVRKILDMKAAGLPVDPMLNFLRKLMENPSKRAIDELLGFLEYGNMPITPEGNFLAYKRIRDDYKDVHSGTIDNSVGQVVRMPRNKVQDNPNITCSHGLHFCSREYLSNFSGNRIVVLEINPADVVSIPKDYNNTKGRCCAYEVIAELPLSAAKTHNWDAPVVDYDVEYDEYEEDEDDEDYDGYCSYCGFTH